LVRSWVAQHFKDDMNMVGNKVVKSHPIENTTLYVSRAVFIFPYGDRQKGGNHISITYQNDNFISSSYDATDVVINLAGGQESSD
jgi:hypothetical protein